MMALRMILPFQINIVEFPLFHPDKAVMTELEGMYSEDKLFLKRETNSAEDMSSKEDGNSKETLNEKEQLELVSNRNVSQMKHAEGIKQIGLMASIKSLLKYTSILPYMWVGGLGIFLLYHLISYLLFYKRLKRWNRPVNNKTNQILSVLLKELKIKKHISIKVNKTVSSPLLIGLYLPRIIIPTEDITDVQMKMIIKHELIHYKHYDLIMKYILCAVNGIHWFNPLVYSMIRSINHDLEVYCDETVLSKQDEDYRRDYGFTILHMITERSRNNNNSFSTSFYGGQRNMKDRFEQIMNIVPRKKGMTLFIVLFCFLLLTGSLVGYKMNTQNKEKLSSTVSDSLLEMDTQAIKSHNVLIVGADGEINNPDSRHGDSIILISIHPDSKEVKIVSFLRDMYVNIPGYKNYKLNEAYRIGGIDLMKRTIEENFKLDINSTIELDYKTFETIIDQLGGINLSLTPQEAEYLNHTNYISNPTYRTLISGEQLLNGNQLLGYARVRHVGNSKGLKGDFGRTDRQRDILIEIFEKCKTVNVSTVLKIFDTIHSYVKIDLDKDELKAYINTILKNDYKINSIQIPLEGTYVPITLDQAFVLDFEMDKNIKALEGE